MVDIESDGPIPGEYSMVSFGAIKVQEDLKNAPVFHGKLCPISNNWFAQALNVSGYSRDETCTFPLPQITMKHFFKWVKEENTCQQPIFIADNNGFDWSFINWYFHKFVGANPFGYSSRNLNDLYKGMKNNMQVNFKHLRKTKHTHNPVDDARGNAEALLSMQKMGLKINLY